jgi:hypothetical protein
MIDKEIYFFDCFGLYHKKNVFNLDDIETCNLAFDQSLEKYNKGIKYYNVFDKHKIFIQLANHAEVKKICKICFGEEYRLDHAFLINQDFNDNIPNDLHGKSFGKNMSHYYLFNAQDHIDKPCFTRTGQLSIGIVLKGQNSNTGGFCYIPGSHKTAYQVSGQNVLEKILENKNFDDYLNVPNLNPGDLIAMPESLIHGQTKMKMGNRRIVYCMFFPLGNKFKNFSSEYKNIQSITDNPEYLKILTEPPEMLSTKTSQSEIGNYKPKNSNIKLT